MTEARAAFFDVDGTLTPVNTWDALLRQPRIGASRRRRIMLRALPAWLAARLRLREDADFRQVWVRAVAAALAGWTRAETDDLFARVVAQMAGALRADVLGRLRQHRERGEHVVLISGLYAPLVEAFAARVGADGGVGSRLVFNRDTCAGRVDGPGCIGPHKLTFVKAYLREQRLQPDWLRCAAYADSFSDLPLLASVGRPVAVYPDRELRLYAANRGWEILGGGSV